MSIKKTGISRLIAFLSVYKPPQNTLIGFLNYSTAHGFLTIHTQSNRASLFLVVLRRRLVFLVHVVHKWQRHLVHVQPLPGEVAAVLAAKCRSVAQHPLRSAWLVFAPPRQRPPCHGFSTSTNPVRDCLVALPIYSRTSRGNHG